MQDVLFFATPFDVPHEHALHEKDWGLGVHLTVRLKRLPRQKCAWCGNRRVCFVLTVEDTVQGPPCCAVHSGIRS